MAHPAHHGEALQGVFRVVDLVSARPEIDDGEIVAALTRDGAS
jgi:hypothetical protein